MDQSPVPYFPVSLSLGLVTDDTRKTWFTYDLFYCLVLGTIYVYVWGFIFTVSKDLY